MYTMIKFRKIWILFVVAFYIILFSNIAFSEDPFTTWKTCFQTFNETCNEGLDPFDNAIGSCVGNQSVGGLDNPNVQEVYINASSFFPGDAINMTCQFLRGGATTYEYIWYNNDSTSDNNWIKIWNNTTSESFTHNVSVVFNVNSSEGTHIARCILSYASMGNASISGSCANNTESSYYDNDDINFTVTGHLVYDFWNLTNYTTGENISSGQTYNRNDSSGNITYINVSARWNKTINNAWIEHNGTGIWRNYTINSTFLGNWTNYTLNLSNSSEFNVETIGIRAIYANDTFWATNNTTPLLYFNLSIGSAPNISSYWFSPSTNRTNLYTNLTIYTNVSDDVGISAVSANITYPSNISFILNFTGDPSPVNQTWSYIFNYTENITLNETGNYTVWWVKVNDTGNQVANLTNNLTFYVTNNLTLSASISPTNPLLDSRYDLSISIFDINGEYHQHTVNITILCGSRTYNAITSESLRNVNYSTTFSECTSPSDYGDIPVQISVSDAYNNIDQQTFTFSTISAPSTPSGPGPGSGGIIPPTKKCSDGTLYDQCSSERPFYCVNGTLIENCSICGCEPGYGCQNNGSCIITRLEDFDFIIENTSVEIRRGEDKKMIGSLRNTGDTILSLISSVEKECCNISIDSSFSLVEREDIDFPIEIHVPLYTNISEYLLKVRIGTTYFKKEKVIKITITENPLIASLKDIKETMTELENEINNYKKVGVNVGTLEMIISESKRLIKDSENYIETDQLTALESSVSKLQENIDFLSSNLLSSRTQKFFFENFWLISSIIVMSMLTIYLVPEVFIPLYKIDKIIKKLVEEEKALIESRVETEKKYFTRKIDKDTFSKIMITQEDKIFKIKALINEKGKEKEKILSLIHPIKMLRWFKRGILSLFKRKRKPKKERLSKKPKPKPEIKPKHPSRFSNIKKKFSLELPKIKISKPKLPKLEMPKVSLKLPKQKKPLISFKSLEIVVENLMIKNVIYLSPEDDLLKLIYLEKKHNLKEIPIIENGRLKGIIYTKDIIMKNVKDPKTKLSTIMRKIPTLSPNLNINDAARIIFDLGVRALPVVKNNKVIGIVSLHDIVNYIFRTKEFRGTKVEKIMDYPVTTSSESTIERARKLMRENKVSRICVVDKKKKLCGILRVSNLLRAMEMEKHPVSTIMDVFPLVSKGNKSLYEIADLMKRNNKDEVIFIEDGFIIGMTTLENLLEFYIFCFRKKGFLNKISRSLKL